MIRQLRSHTRLCIPAMIALAILPGGSTASAEKAGRFVNRVYKDAAGAHKYVVFEPAGYATNKSKKTWPVILFLHGAGERGSDGQREGLLAHQAKEIATPPPPQERANISVQGRARARPSL